MRAREDFHEQLTREAHAGHSASKTGEHQRGDVSRPLVILVTCLNDAVCRSSGVGVKMLLNRVFDLYPEKDDKKEDECDSE